MDVHALQRHLDNVNKLCRVCGNCVCVCWGGGGGGRAEDTMTDVKLPKTVKAMKHEFCIISALPFALHIFYSLWQLLTQLRFVSGAAVIFAISANAV